MNEEIRYVPWDVHKEFAERIDAEEKRQNKRLDALEETTQRINQFAVSMEKLAVNMEHIAKEQVKQSEQLDEQDKKLDELKLEPGKKWNAIIMGIIAAVVGFLISALMNGLF